MASSSSLRMSRLLYGGAYAAAAVLGAAVASLTPASDPYARALAGGAVATVFLYAVGVALRNSGFYDVYWSAFPVVAGGFLMQAHGAWESGRAWLAWGVASLWGIRLTTNWIQHFEGLSHEDWRYVDMRKKTKGAYPIASFFALHVFPFTLVSLGTWPIAMAIEAKGSPGPLELAAAALGVAAVLVETIADVQLHAFRRDNRDPLRFLDTGLWAYSRHPNYFGEALAWWSFALFGLAVRPSLLCVLGALGVTAMILFASIPMAEQRALAKRPRFAEYQRRVSRLVPFFPMG